MVVFGGQNYDLRRKYSNVARFDMEQGRWLSTNEEYEHGPCARSSHASVSTRDSLYVFGGATGISFLSSPGCCRDASTWRFNHRRSEWSKLDIPGLDQVSARYGHTTVISKGERVYLFGGMTDAGCDSNTYLIDLKAKEVRQLACRFVGTSGDVCTSVGSEPPSGVRPPRDNPSATTPTTPEQTEASGVPVQPPPLETSSGEAMEAVQEVFVDLMEDLAGMALQDGTSSLLPYRPQMTAKQVRERVRGFGHTAIYNRHTDCMYVLGGTVDGRHYHSAFVRFDLKTHTWSVEQSLNKPPQGRYVHCASFDERKNAMYVFGGYCGAYTNDVFEYNFATRRWRQIQPRPGTPVPSLRSGACSAIWRDHLYVFGGCDDTKYYSDVWRLRLWNDTLSLKETMLDHVAWLQVSAGLFNPEGIPEGVSTELEKRRDNFRKLFIGRSHAGTAAARN